MARLSRSIRRRVVAAAVGGAAVVASLVGVACVLVDPPPDLPAETQLHPIVIKSSVFPPTTQVLAELPASGFQVPIQVFESDTAFEYEVFVDFDPLAPTPQTPVIAATASPPFALDGGVNIVDFDLTAYSATLDPSACHQIDFVVALGFDPGSLHTPDSRGGDSVAWFYDPSGGFAGCPNGGVTTTDAAPPDASDAGMPATGDM
jgi:hypothetical protein